MISDPALREALDEAAETYPYPIAAACAEVRDTEPRDDWHEWELLSRDVLTPVLTYLSHLLLSDLVATGREPARLFHRIESVLSRPLAGHYVGFLRETATYYREEGVETAVPDLVDFLLEAEVDGTLTDSGRPLLGELVDFRNRWAHGRIENEDVVENSLRQIRTLIGRLLEETRFLSELPLRLEDGTELMGSEPDLPEQPMPLVTVTAETTSGEGVSLRPLLLKLEGRVLSVLAEADLAGRRLTYRSPGSYAQLSEEKSEAAERLFEELKSLLQEVRSLEATLPTPDLETFRERVAVQTNRTRTLYGKENLGKYDKDLYIQRPEWEAEGGHFWDFLESEKTLLAIDGEQGTGKSALAARLSERAEEAGHAVWFLNAQRFTFAEVSWSGNPFPRYFANRLSYEAPFDAEAIETLAEETEGDERIILFVDGINEIDAVSDEESPWDRFEAITRFLEWTEEIAHPKLKVVLTFRTEAYTRFAYLQAGNVPERIEEISFRAQFPSETNPSREGMKKLTWVNRIDPFTEKQARRLYEGLQKLEERGMAPDMTWDEIREGLGEDLETFITNPLLFTIFLRAHDGESEIISTDQGELFTRYANGVTGARERQEWPWWKRAYYFIKNGNITDRERFLADCVDKASENGSTSFLLSDLEDENDRDNRILELVSEPGKREDIDALEEGDIISINKGKEKKDIGVKSKRVSFVSEVVSKTVNRVRVNVRKKKSIEEAISLWSSLVTILFFLVLVISLVHLFWIGINWSGIKANELSGDLPTQGFRSLYIDLIIHILLPYSVVVLGLSILTSKVGYVQSITSVDIGIVESSYKNYVNKKLTYAKNTIWTVFIWIFTPLALLKSVMLGLHGESSIPVLYLGILFILFFVIFSTPDINKYYVINELEGSLKIKGRVFSNIYNKIDSLEGPGFLSKRYIIVFIILLINMYVSYDLVDYYTLPAVDRISTYSNFITSRSSYEVYMWAANWHNGFILTCSISIPILVMGIISDKLSYIWERRKFLVYSRSVFDKKIGNWTFWAIFAALFLLLFNLIPTSYTPKLEYFINKKGGTNEIEKLENVYKNTEEYKISTEEGYIINLTDTIISNNIKREIKSLRVQSLHLDPQQLDDISLSSLNEIDSLKIYGDLDRVRNNDKSLEIRYLSIKGNLDYPNNLCDMFPNVITLSLREETLKNISNFECFWGNTVIHVINNQPNLKWFTSKYSHFILEVNSISNLHDSALYNISYLSLPFHSTSPKVIAKMDNLKWLHIIGSPCSTKDISKEQKIHCDKLSHISQTKGFNLIHSQSDTKLSNKKVSPFEN